MSLEVTLAILAAAVGVLIIARWRAKKPKQDGEIRFVPWTAIIFAAIIVIFVMLAHLITLLTGEPFKGRRG